MRYHHIQHLRRLSTASSCSSSSSSSSSSANAEGFPSSPSQSTRRPSLRSLWSRHDYSDDAASRRPHGRQDSSASTPSRRSCEGMTVDETRALWKCMLGLQRRYGCYNSTRIDLAVQAGDEGLHLMPNPFIIDTLNNSVVELPAEGWKKLDRCLMRSSPPGSPQKQKSRFRFWNRI
ncbi:hypothetical protein HIM_01175 [Hirsutella minnesotensis 3608]|uniref:Uncharacterized protein n=1 Tax=Hirsutella minnesotensis 3608 TaxID=1043627 RepID=A0A0F7ZWH3_9HYPO|nr:hypothetical protein HIM_11645 [Hirsutella minnesotensis 3608]KJZ79706.1 hypothetical protein HIM_01175 [Hirsutella minnesotensis 3608]